MVDKLPLEDPLGLYDQLDPVKSKGLDAWRERMLGYVKQVEDEEAREVLGEVVCAHIGLRKQVLALTALHEKTLSILKPLVADKIRTLGG